MITILKILGILWAVLIVIGIVLSIINTVSRYRLEKDIDNNIEEWLKSNSHKDEG
jgi:hypothetical protein